MNSNPDDHDPQAVILKAAAEIFAEHGFAGARVEAIAQAAGINKAMLYYRVGDKARLYELVIVEYYRQAVQAAEEAAAGPGGPQARLSRVINALAGIFAADPLLPRIMAWEVTSGGANLPPCLPKFMQRLLGVVAPLARAMGLDPFCTHFTIMGSLMFTAHTAPLRKRLAPSLPQEFAGAGQVELSDMAFFLESLFCRNEVGDKI